MMQKEYCHSPLSVYFTTLYLSLAPIPITNRFKLYFTPISQVLFIVPSQYFFSIGVSPYLDFEEGTPFFKQIMLDSFYSLALLYLHPSGLLPPPFWYIFYFVLDSYNIAIGLFYFHSPLLIESRLISFLLVTQMFHFTKLFYCISLLRFPHSILCYHYPYSF